jgi:hypothetical protein
MMTEKSSMPITLTVEGPGSYDKRLVHAYQDSTGKLYHDEGCNQPLKQGEVVTWGYSSRSGSFGKYDYATGKHSAEIEE